MTSKVSSGQSELYRTRMLPVVSTSAHGSLPRDSRKEPQKTRSSSEVNGRKIQAHGFKPLFPLDSSNFVSKIIDRNTQDTSETKDPKPRLITPVNSTIAKPLPYPKEESEEPPKLPPRKRLPSHPPTGSSEGSQLHHQFAKTERRTLPVPRTEKIQSENVGKSQNVSELNDRTQGHSVRSEGLQSQNSKQIGLKCNSKIPQSNYTGRKLPVSRGSGRKTNFSSGKNEQLYEKGESKESVKLDQNFDSKIHSHITQENSSVDFNEAQPLTRTNVTQHDKIWVKDEPKHEPGKLIPPLQDITPETTEELWNNYDPLDNLDSGSESSADTMIMMTTEEEERNEQKILQNQKKYETIRNGEKTPTRETGNNVHLPNGMYLKHSKDLDLSPKSSEEDDGYGTNSSTSTNFSSLSSLGNYDNESKPLHGILKKTNYSVSNGVKPGVIVSSSTTLQNGQTHSTWAVRRRTKMTESQDNSLQEKLRQLAIIEEENTHDENADDRLGIVRRNSDSSNTGSYGYSSDNDTHWKNVVNSAPSRDGTQIVPRGRPSEEEEKQEEVIQNDLKKFEGELYDKLTDMDLNYRNYYGFDQGQVNEKDDSKVLYFQQKMIKQQYGNDNYYNPCAYQKSPQEDQIDCSRAHKLPTQFHNIGKDMPSMPDLCRRAYSQDLRQLQNYGGVPNGYESQNTSYRSLASYNSGHMSLQDHVNGSTDNISVHSGYSMPGNLYKTKYVSVDNIHQNGRKTNFASSADIYNLFQSKENLATQLQRPASYRHSFHAVPMSVAAGKSDPNYDIFNEKEEPRPRSSSTSVGSKNKSWNPFGSLFGKKRSKTAQSHESLSKTDKSSKQAGQEKVKGQASLQKRDQIHPTPEMLPRRQLMEENGPVSPPIIKSSTLPHHTSEKMFPDKPFKTIALFEESGTKLSTLV